MYAHIHVQVCTCAYKDEVSSERLKRLTALYSNLKSVLGVKCSHQGRKKTTEGKKKKNALLNTLSGEKETLDGRLEKIPYNRKLFIMGSSARHDDNVRAI